MDSHLIRDKKNKFFERLSNGDPSLPDDLTSASGAGLKSISSKICKYLCEYIYGFHNYFINDSYIRKALPFYLESYGFDFKSIKINDNIVIHIKSSSDCDNLNYRDLHYILCQLLDKANEEAKTFKDRISPDELDRIIWYAYKSFT